jgi:BirA family biotin operon repressor/biotin-[acetyl-CoA-carboxylase] ligase
VTSEDWSTLRPPIGRFDRVQVFDEARSTQGNARLLCEGLPGLAVIAKRQLAGRGRQGRVWDDGGGASLSMSTVVESRLPAAGLSLAVGLGVIQACAELGAAGLGLKWPNDVVERIDGKRGRKLAGILIEGDRSLAIVGVGLNVSTKEGQWGPELDGVAVSLAQLGVDVDRPTVARAVLEGVSRWLDASPADIRARWLEIGTLRGGHGVFRVDGQPVAGIVVDLDEQWRLVLETDAGSRVRIDAAHAHLEESRPVGS